MPDIDFLKFNPYLVGQNFVEGRDVVFAICSLAGLCLDENGKPEPKFAMWSDEKQQLIVYDKDNKQFKIHVSAEPYTPPPEEPNIDYSFCDL